MKVAIRGGLKSVPLLRVTLVIGVVLRESSLQAATPEYRNIIFRSRRGYLEIEIQSIASGVIVANICIALSTSKFRKFDSEVPFSMESFMKILYQISENLAFSEH